MSAKTIMEKRQQVNKLVMDVRTIIDKADNEKRALSQEEKNSISTMETDIDRLDSEVQLEERQLERERSLTKDKTNPEEERTYAVRDSVEYRSAFARFLQDGERAIFTEAERRAMQADNALTGGTFMAPTTYINELIKDIDNATVIRGLARVFPLGAGVTSMGAPSLDNDIDDSDWTPEIKAVQESADMKFGERELTPHQISKLVKLSNKLIAGATQSVDSLVRERLAYKFGITEEKAFMFGDGSQKPLGLFVPSKFGIDTDKDIVGSNTASKISSDTLIDALYDLKEGYQKNATWLFHRTIVKEIRKLKDNNGQYLWQPALTGGNPSTILERPYVTSEYAPNALTTGQYVGMIGDFKYYWIADAMGLSIQVLKELFALTKQTGYIGLLEVDGMPVQSNAFRRIKMG